MFCTGCGKPLASGARFCAACGAPVTAAATPSAAPSAGAERFSVSVQGVDGQVSRATGEFDTVELGELGREQLEALFERLAGFEVPAETEGDFCPPHVIAEAAGRSCSFMLDGGRIVPADVGAPVTARQAVDIAAGALDPVALRPPKPFPRGMRPLRRPDLRPTFTDTLEASRIDTGPASPQAEAAGSRVGLDWRSNTLWFQHDGKLHYEPHASCLREVRVRSSRTGGIRFVKAGQQIWTLDFVYADDFVTTCTKAFHAERDAQAIAETANRLLASGG